MEQPVAIIGIGTIGSMLLRASARYSPGRYRLLAAGRNRALLEALSTEIPLLETGGVKAIAATADIIIVCVPPQHYLDVVADIAPAISPRGILVSVTNGVALDAIAARVSVPIVKVIPSVAHTCGRGVSLVARGPGASDVDLETITAFFAPFSRPVVIPATDSRVATNITGCGPALFAFFAETLVKASAKRAVTLDVATLSSMVTETLAATAAMIETGVQLSEVVRHAATGGGMTEVALQTLATELPQLLDAMTEATFAREGTLSRSTQHCEKKI